MRNVCGSPGGEGVSTPGVVEPQAMQQASVVHNASAALLLLLDLIRAALALLLLTCGENLCGSSLY